MSRNAVLALILSLSAGFALLFGLLLTIALQNRQEESARPPDVPSGFPLSLPQAAATDASKKAVTLGSVQITVVRCEVAPAMYRGFLGEDESAVPTEKPFLQVYLRVDNQSDRRKIDYSSWSRLKALDDLGNSYDSVFAGKLVGQSGSRALYPGQTVLDMLCFEPPVDKANSLTLRLTGLAVDAPGEAVFLIPQKMWKAP